MQAAEPTGQRIEERIEGRRDEYLFAAPTPDGRMRLARAYLESHPRCWPYCWAAADAHMGLGPAASAYEALNLADFTLLVAAAAEKMFAVAGRAAA